LQSDLQMLNVPFTPPTDAPVKTSTGQQHMLLPH
jgi:hypothetical protein